MSIARSLDHCILNVDCFVLFIPYYHKNKKSVLIHDCVNPTHNFRFIVLLTLRGGGRGLPREGEPLVDTKPRKLGTDAYGV